MPIRGDTIARGKVMLQKQVLMSENLDSYALKTILSYLLMSPVQAFNRSFTYIACISSLPVDRSNSAQNTLGTNYKNHKSMK